MKPLLLQVRVLTAAVSVIFLIASAAASEATVDLTVGKICFLRNGWVFIKDLATGKETKLVEGGSARLAPTGDSIVFISITEQDPFMASLVAPPGRLRVLTLKTMKSRSFDSLRESRISDAVWSSTGKIAFARPENDKRSIAMLNPVTGDVEKNITADWNAVIGPNEGIYLDSWAPGNRSVLFHTLNALYEADFETGSVRKILAEGVFDKILISSASTFVFSSDRKYLLFDGMIDTREEPEQKLISLYDLTAKTLRRITPKHVNASAPVWVNDLILFTRADYDYVKYRWVHSICKIRLDGTGLTTLIKNADFVSYAPK